jgi:hypothetical protein
VRYKKGFFVRIVFVAILGKEFYPVIFKKAISLFAR